MNKKMVTTSKDPSPKFFFFLAALRLHCCLWAFSTCGERRLLCSCGAQASHWGGRAQFPGMRASIVMANGLSCSVACGVFLGQGLNQCRLHLQADS